MGGLAETLYVLKAKNLWKLKTCSSVWLGEAETSGVWFVVIEVYMAYNIVLVSARQHNDLIAAYIAKWSSK